MNYIYYEVQKKKEREKKGRKEEKRKDERKGLFRLTELNINILIWIKIPDLYFVELKASQLTFFLSVWCIHVCIHVFCMSVVYLYVGICVHMWGKLLISTFTLPPYSLRQVLSVKLRACMYG